MRVEIDALKCEGHGRCYAFAPAIFDADDDGRGLVLLADVPPDLEAAARTAVQNCPERAILFVDPDA